MRLPNGRTRGLRDDLRSARLPVGAAANGLDGQLHRGGEYFARRGVDSVDGAAKGALDALQHPVAAKPDAASQQAHAAAFDLHGRKRSHALVVQPDG